MDQKEVLKALEASAKVGGKAFLADLIKDGGAVDLEVKVLAEQMGPYGPMIAPMLAPFAKQILATIAEQI